MDTFWTLSLWIHCVKKKKKKVYITIILYEMTLVFIIFD